MHQCDEVLQCVRGCGDLRCHEGQKCAHCQHSYPTHGSYCTRNRLHVDFCEFECIEGKNASLVDSHIAGQKSAACHSLAIAVLVVGTDGMEASTKKSDSFWAFFTVPSVNVATTTRRRCGINWLKTNVPSFARIPVATCSKFSAGLCRRLRRHTGVGSRGCYILISIVSIVVAATNG